MLATRYRVSAYARPLAGFVLGFAVVMAGSAYGANHDVQRAPVHKAGAIKHDRALGPVASAETATHAIN